MSTPPAPDEDAVRAITPESQPVFPCWLWVAYRPLSGGVPSWEYLSMAPDMAAWNVTHWHPDQPTPPTVTPAQPKREVTGTPTKTPLEHVLWMCRAEDSQVSFAQLKEANAELTQIRGDLMTAMHNLNTVRSQLSAQSARLAEVEGSAVFWNAGYPTDFHGEEWFLARLKDGCIAVLTALPEDWSHDFKTADETYYTKDWVVRWAQFPTSEYRTPLEDAAKEITALQSRATAAEQKLQQATAEGEELRKALLTLCLSIENHEELEPADFDEALEHNFRATFRAVLDSIKQARSVLARSPKESTP